MMKGHWRIPGLVVIVGSLGACHSVMGIHFARHAAPEYRQLVRIDGSTEAPASGSATAEGRSDLDSGKPGAAVEAFQKALGLGEPIAPAANGMAVAYASLGRYDLARRFFEQAISAQPDDARYAENLARLARAEQLAASRAIATLPLASTAAVQPAVRTAEASASRPGAQLQRISPREVRLVLNQAPAGAGNRQPVYRIRSARNDASAASTAEVARGFRPIIRIVLAAPPGDRAAAPAQGFKPVIRLSLAERK